MDIFGDEVPDMEHLDGEDEFRFNHFYMTFVHVLRLYTIIWYYMDADPAPIYTTTEYITRRIVTIVG